MATPPNAPYKVKSREFARRARMGYLYQGSPGMVIKTRPSSRVASDEKYYYVDDDGKWLYIGKGRLYTKSVINSFVQNLQAKRVAARKRIRDLSKGKRRQAKKPTLRERSLSARQDRREERQARRERHFPQPLKPILGLKG